MFEAAEFIAAYSVWLVVFGTIGNALALYVCIQLSHRHKAFVFLAFMSASDTASLYRWDLNFLPTFFGIDLSKLSIYSCRFLSFVQFSSLQISAWILVSSTPRTNGFDTIESLDALFSGSLVARPAFYAANAALERFLQAKTVRPVLHSRRDRLAHCQRQSPLRFRRGN